jgi:hypothetical protein
MSKLPNFVNMVSKPGSNTALRLVKAYGNKNFYGYYRDGGDWECDYVEKNGELFSSSHITSIDGHKLVPITEEKWRKCNGRYAPRAFERYGIDTYSFGSNPCAEIALPQEKNKYKYLLIRRR